MGIWRWYDRRTGRRGDCRGSGWYVVPMLPKHLTLSAAAVYLMGVLVGFTMDPPLEAGYSDGLVPLRFLVQPKSQLFWSIAGNNISVALINLFGGFSLGLVSMLNTFYNGVILGYACSVSMDHFPVLVLIRHLLPHAIEILAIILSCSLGVLSGQVSDLQASNGCQIFI